MELNINILDSFPSINKLSKEICLIVELNKKIYNLEKLILNKEQIYIKENLSKLFIKLYALQSNKKKLIGINQINLDDFRLEEKCSILWIEFKRGAKDNNNNDINDIYLMIYDVLRIKLKIQSFLRIPKTDRRVKSIKNNIEISPYTRVKDQSKNKYNISEKNINPITVINNDLVAIRVNSPSKRTKNDNDNLYKDDQFKDTMSNYYCKKENNNIGITNINNNSITEEYLNDIMLQSEALLTENNLFANNCSNSTSLDENTKLKNHFIQKNNNEAPNEVFYTQIKEDNNFLNNSNQKMTSSTEKEEKLPKNLIKDHSFNSNPLYINKYSTKNNSQKINKVKINHKKNKSLNFIPKGKLPWEENNNQIKINLKKGEGDNNYKPTEEHFDIIESKRINKVGGDDFFSTKKNFDLFYTSNFINNVQNDLLKLELNLAVNKSFDLFTLYNKEKSHLTNEYNDLIKMKNNYQNMLQDINKKIDKLKSYQRRCSNKTSNNLIKKESPNPFKIENFDNIKLFHNIIFGNIYKKEKLKLILGVITDNNNNQQALVCQNKTNKKIGNKSPVRNNLQTKFKSEKIISTTFKKKFNTKSKYQNKKKIIKNDNLKYTVLKMNKSVNKQSYNDKNYKSKNVSDLVHNRNIFYGNMLEKENRSGDNNSSSYINNYKKNDKNNFYYMTSMNKFYKSKNK